MCARYPTALTGKRVAESLEPFSMQQKVRYLTESPNKQVTLLHSVAVFLVAVICLFLTRKKLGQIKQRKQMRVGIAPASDTQTSNIYWKFWM